MAREFTPEELNSGGYRIPISEKQSTTSFAGTATTGVLSEVFGGSTPFLVYRAVLTGNGEDAPTVNVLENTLGTTLTWSRFSAGIYITGSSNMPVGSEKSNTLTLATIGGGNSDNDAYSTSCMLVENPRTIRVETFRDGLNSDSWLTISIEIKVYL